MQGRYKRARDFQESSEMIRYHLPKPKTCQFYNARIFHRETSTMCYMNGRISLPNLPTSSELLELFCDQTVNFNNNMLVTRTQLIIIAKGFYYAYLLTP